MVRGVDLAKYGINGRHGKIGRDVPDPEFKGFAIEAFTTIKEDIKQMREDFKKHQEQDNVNFGNLKSFQDDLKGKITVGAIIGVAIVSGLIAKLIGWL